MNDALKHAFTELRKHGILALHDWTCCNTCGLADVEQLVYELAARNKHVRGFVFYHAQATDAALRDGVLYLNFGNVGTDDSDAAAEVIGKEIVAALQAAGLATEWTGSANQKIVAKLTGELKRTRTPGTLTTPTPRADSAAA